MKWKKKGMVYTPDSRMTWAKHSALTPTPVLFDDEIIRVYAGFRDDKGVSRIGYVDLDASDPSNVLNVSREPALDIGVPGAFDDNGVILGDVIKVNEEFRMYYVGFQLVGKVKFLAFTGLAVSTDGGCTFRRLKNTPILDRSDEGMYIRAIHTVIFEDDIWKVWYAAGSNWAWIDGNPFPRYITQYIESEDGVNFGDSGIRCLDYVEDEYRIGRPRVYHEQDSNIYKMYYTKGTLQKDYLPGYAESYDGVCWIRKDDKIGIGLSPSGWDSQTLSYPSLLKYGNKTYMFYNGNDMGKTGFGYAELDDEEN